jgi:hypothetical protein
MEHSKDYVSLRKRWYRNLSKKCFLFALVFLQTTRGAKGQTDRTELPLNLRINVVRIESYRNGFGFIVGERNGFLYVVTARHVIAGNSDNPDSKPSKTVKITFYSEQENAYDAKVLRADSMHDLALLSVPTPRGFRWQPKCLAGAENANRGSHVWFVGRNATWYVPVEPGAVTSERPGIDSRIQLERLEVREGTSGAPLISDAGIVGMIQSDSNDDTRALTIAFIHSAIQEWNDPWDLESTTPSRGGTETTTLLSDGPCQIRIGSSPSGADVTIDGNSRGNTPTTIELTRQSHTLKIERDKYEPYEKQVDCNTKSVDAKLKKAVGDIRLQYTGDYLSCSLGLTVTIGDKTVHPAGNSFLVRDVALGEQEYSIEGRIGCPTAGMCNARGSGSIDVHDGSVFNVAWLNTAYATCDIELIPQ